MKKTYKEFLNEINIISEEEFDNLMSKLPDVDIDFDFSELYEMDYDSIDNIAVCIINTILNDFNYVYVEDADVSEGVIELADVETIEDLEKIKNLFSFWEISNYDDIVELIKQDEEEKILNNKRNKLAYSIINNLPEEEIDKLLKQYDKE